LPLVLGGFSFGSVVALRVAARDARVGAVFALGYPLPGAGPVTGDAAALEAVRQPRLFVQGEDDVFGPAEVLRALVEALPPPREMFVVPGADHYFAGQLDALQGLVARWAGARPWEAATSTPGRRAAPP
jgi:alpha/beta superfamily hydrolase